MLFNSYEFIFLFMPICVFGYFVCAKYLSLESALGFLVFSSLVFYGYWNPKYLVLLLFSIGFNYCVGGVLARGPERRKHIILVLGIAVNLGFLGYFKYANFLLDNVNLVLDTHWNAGHIFLPLAISFFTFQQISYLVDARQGKTREYNFLHYCLFVSFFPQLIAGPIVHHKEMIPQFMRAGNLFPKWSNFAIGVSIFAIGLFKKTVIADSLSSYVSPVYDVGGAAAQVDFFRAWGSTLAYTFQLYFDFSGYSDMAIGCARIFGIVLPVNFFSPYKATNIIEFWRRWHITLSRFLRDYLYISLGGNRKGTYRRYVNLFVTMLLGGLWHGAGWPFVVWGALHGSYLMVNHGWTRLLEVLGIDPSGSMPYRACAWLLTFLAVVFSWVYFRAPTIEQANHIVLAMLGASGFEVPAGILARTGALGAWFAEVGGEAAYGGGAVFVGNFTWVVAAGLCALLLPNVAQMFNNYDAALYEHPGSFRDVREVGWLNWHYSNQWAAAISVAFLAGVLTLSQVSEFLYFQF
ncbi:MAG: MBOAT family protein [Pseudomonadales bacterium]|nr:MBOAT family protein [Pseudomonadales bacterium]